MLVVYDNGSTPSTINVRDGMDLAFQGFSAPLDTTVPQTLTYASAAADRGASVDQHGRQRRVDRSQHGAAERAPRHLRRESRNYNRLRQRVHQRQRRPVGQHPPRHHDPRGIDVDDGAGALADRGRDDEPAGALGWVTSALSITNLPPPPPPVGATPLTPGYWKNHLAPVSATCAPKNGCSNNGPWTSQYLPQSLGNYSVDTTAKVTAVFAGMNCSSSSSQDAIGCLAGHLLATELNLANGSSTCIAGTVADANAFLKSQVVMGVTGITYTGPSGTYTLTSAQRALAIQLKNKMDTYNNGGGC